LRLPAEPYFPQPGDIFLATDNLWFHRITHRLALSGPPHHSGIIFQRPDGSMAILEAGPHNDVRVQCLDFLAHVKSHDDQGEKVWIRRRRVPLTPEQSAKLTAFALAQDGKPFATIRLAGQLTLLRSRGPIRTYFMGGPHGERDTYFCSELALESCVAAGLLDPAKTRPAATYPRDIFFGKSLNPFIKDNLEVNAWWFPPARWTGCPYVSPTP
jgi:hypothetical protein